jgi:hypothetical protein
VRERAAARVLAALVVAAAVVVALLPLPLRQFVSFVFFGGLLVFGLSF